MNRYNKNYRTDEQQKNRHDNLHALDGNGHPYSPLKVAPRCSP